MVREIKFRAWSFINKDMKEVNYIDFGNRIAETKKDKLGCWDSFKVKDKELVLMQFIGLKDKNGKEIYEGDILRNYDYNEKWDDGAIGDVDWDKECGGFRFNWKILLAKSGERDFRKPIGTICSTSAYNSDKREEEEFEVIGNIYENPKLLENKDETNK